MRKIILYIACSLDGYIADKEGRVDWLYHDQDYGYEEFKASVDTIIMGRKTFDQVNAFGEWPYAGMETIVLSRTRSGKENDWIIFENDLNLDFIKKLKEQSGKDIWLLGGAKVIQYFLKHDLIDEYKIFIQPILLGGGIPLFPAGFDMLILQFKGSNTFSSGFVQLNYEKAINQDNQGKEI